MPSARDLIEHLERGITTDRTELEAVVDRLDAKVAMRELYFAADIDPDDSYEAALAAMTPDEESRARLAALAARAVPEPKENK